MGVANTGFWIGALAHSLIGVSLVWDKVLLGRRETSTVVSYVFWLGILSFVGVGVACFGFHWPSPRIMCLGLAAGLIHMVANFYYYVALKRGEASRAIAILGGFSPVATSLIAIPLLGRPVGASALNGFVLMTAGGFVMFFSDRMRLGGMLPVVLAAAAASGLGNVMQKIVFEAVGFDSGYVFFTLGSTAGAALLLLRSKWRQQIFQQSRAISGRNKFWYLMNRALSGLGAILIYFAISRISPATVDAMSGLRYAIVFVGAYALSRVRPQWLHEEFSVTAVVAKTAGTLLVIAGLTLVALNGQRAEGALLRPAYVRSRAFYAMLRVPPPLRRLYSWR